MQNKTEIFSKICGVSGVACLLIKNPVGWYYLLLICRTKLPALPAPTPVSFALSPPVSLSVYCYLQFTLFISLGSQFPWLLVKSWKQFIESFGAAGTYQATPTRPIGGQRGRGCGGRGCGWVAKRCWATFTLFAHVKGCLRFAFQANSNNSNNNNTARYNNNGHNNNNNMKHTHTHSLAHTDAERQLEACRKSHKKWATFIFIFYLFMLNSWHVFKLVARQFVPFYLCLCVCVRVCVWVCMCVCHQTQPSWK